MRHTHIPFTYLHVYMNTISKVVVSKLHNISSINYIIEFRIKQRIGLQKRFKCTRKYPGASLATFSEGCPWRYHMWLHFIKYVGTFIDYNKLKHLFRGLAFRGRECQQLLRMQNHYNHSTVGSLVLHRCLLFYRTSYLIASKFSERL